MTAEFVIVLLSYFFLETVTIGLMHTLTDLKVKNKMAAFIFIAAASVLTAFADNGMIEISPAADAVLLLIYGFRKLILYICVFGGINLNIVYIFAAASVTNSIFTILLRLNFGDKIYRLGAAYLLQLLILALILVCIKCRKKEEGLKLLLHTLPKRLYIRLLILLILVLLFVTVTSIGGGVESFILFFFIPFIFDLVISTIILIRTSSSEKENRAIVALLSKQVENQIEYYEKINKIYGEFRSFRHDYKNHVLCLRSLIAAGKTEEALEYMETIRDMSSVEKNEFRTGNVIIDALLNDKSEKAEALNTRIDFNGIVPTEGISNADLCIIMANAIDNAIEACAKDTSEEAKVIKIDADFKQGFFFFRAVNPVFEEVQFKGKNKVVTSKSDKDKHGFGVANIVRTAEKYGGTADISADNGEFAIEVQLTLEQA